jgi:hypothetical protein
MASCLESKADLLQIPTSWLHSSVRSIFWVGEMQLVTIPLAFANLVRHLDETEADRHELLVKTGGIDQAAKSVPTASVQHCSSASIHLASLGQRAVFTVSTVGVSTHAGDNYHPARCMIM